MPGGIDAADSHYTDQRCGIGGRILKVSRRRKTVVFVYRNCPVVPGNEANVRDSPVDVALPEARFSGRAGQWYAKGVSLLRTAGPPPCCPAETKSLLPRCPDRRRVVGASCFSSLSVARPTQARRISFHPRPRKSRAVCRPPSCSSRWSCRRSSVRKSRWSVSPVSIPKPPPRATFVPTFSRAPAW
jgi:hypothetical protein